MIFQSLLEFALILSFWSTYIVILYESAFLIIPLKKIALKIHKESSLKEDLVREGERNFPGGSVAKTLLPMQRPGFDPWSGNSVPHATNRSLHATTKNPTYCS